MTPRILFTAGWRAFFWAAGLWALLCIALWLIWLGVHAAGLGVMRMGFSMPPHLWHAHEMVFGFTSAAIAGFLLTAVPNWTGGRPAPQRFIALAAMLWLAGRLAIWFSGVLPAGLVAAIDLAFLPILMLKILIQLLARPKPQNIVILAVLSLIWAGNLLVHLEWMGLAQTAWQGLRGGMLTICALIAILGGRVTPAFTRNAMLRTGRETGLPVNRAPLTAAGIGAAILTAAAQLLGLPDGVIGTFALAAGLAAGLRLAGWRGLALPGQPILWALHLAYGTLALGYLAWGAALWGLGSEVGALHILAIGAIGGMTLAIMSRATLGHAGRPLIAPEGVALAYALMPLAALLRWIGSTWIVPLYYPGVLASGLIWCLAFALYLFALWPIFFAPRRSRD